MSETCDYEELAKMEAARKEQPAGGRYHDEDPSIMPAAQHLAKPEQDALAFGDRVELIEGEGSPWHDDYQLMAGTVIGKRGAFFDVRLDIKGDTVTSPAHHFRKLPDAPAQPDLASIAAQVDAVSSALEMSLNKTGQPFSAEIAGIHDALSKLFGKASEIADVLGIQHDPGTFRPSSTALHGIEQRLSTLERLEARMEQVEQHISLLDQREPCTVSASKVEYHINGLTDEQVAKLVSAIEALKRGTAAEGETCATGSFMAAQCDPPDCKCAYMTGFEAAAEGDLVYGLTLDEVEERAVEGNRLTGIGPNGRPAECVRLGSYAVQPWEIPTARLVDRNHAQPPETYRWTHFHCKDGMFPIQPPAPAQPTAAEEQQR